MPYQLYHFNGSKEFIKSNSMVSDLAMTAQHVLNTISGAFLREQLLRIALDEMGWTQGDTWNIVAGKKCRYLGCKRGVGLEANLGIYDYIVEGAMRLQVGYDKGQIDAGILLLTNQGMPKCMEEDIYPQLEKDMNALAPTISLPLCICLYDFSNQVGCNGQ